MFHKFARYITTVFLFFQATLMATETKCIECEEHAFSQMQTFIVSPQDLHFDQNNIFMNINGCFYEVYPTRS